MIKKTSLNQLCGKDVEYITGAFLKSFSIILYIDGYSEFWKRSSDPITIA